jgi:hypothetical protein
VTASEHNVKPKITGADGEVHIDLTEGSFLHMPADTAEEFARQVLVAVLKARGETGAMFVIPVKL